MSQDLAREIVRLAVGSCPTVHIYRMPFVRDNIPPSFESDSYYFDEIIVCGSIVTHKFVCVHGLGQGFVPNYARHTDEILHRIDLACKDVPTAMRIAFQTNSNARWGIDVNGTRIYEFIINSTEDYPLEKQKEFKNACDIVSSYK